MADRLLITFIILVGLELLWHGWRYYKNRVTRSIRPVETETGAPTLLYFSGEYCAACKFQQTPVVDELAAKWGAAIVVKKYDVTQSPDLALHYKILTLPTTVVLNRQGQVAHINYGVAALNKLESQLL